MKPMSQGEKKVKPVKLSVMRTEETMTGQDRGFRAAVKEIVSDCSLDWEMSADEATDRIVSLVRELVPENDDDKPNREFATGYVAGWNACRDSILSRLEEK